MESTSPFYQAGYQALFLNPNLKHASVSHYFLSCDF